jgi:diguanylate cyclase (GGDEF)-like protein
MQAPLLASYLLSALLLAPLAGEGVIDPVVPWAYAAAGIAAVGICAALLGSGWSERVEDHFLIMPQMLVNSAINLAFIAWVPQIGVLLLMVLFVIYAFGSLRMSGRHVLPVAIAIAVVLGVVITLVGDRLSLPVATLQQRMICGLWFALTLARGAMLGTYSDQLRKQLAQRNADLAAVFQKLERMASRDELTGLLNRRSGLQLLEEERGRMARTGQRFGVALLDVDHFKRVNDTFGHIIGDEILRRFSSTASAATRDTDRLARYGGEEFLLLLTATASEQSAIAATERIRGVVERRDWSELTPGFPVTVSAGVAICRDDEPAEALLGRADRALYLAKREGRNCVRAG